MTVAAVIPHWNRRDLLAALLENLERQTRPLDEIIVVDNGSTDDSAEIAERAGARVICLGRNFGFAAAVNRGIEAAAADWIAILNNDVTLDPRWLETLLAAGPEWFATGKTLSASEPKIIDGAFDEISRGACALRCGAGRPDSEFWDHGRQIRMAPMTAAIFRRDLFAEVGPLDESFGSYLEDVDFGIRCALAGKPGVYVPAAVAWHRGSATFGRWNKDTVRLIARNQMLLARKHFGGQPRWPIMAGQLLWGPIAFRHGRGLSWLKGRLSGRHLGVSSGSEVASAPKLAVLLEESERALLEVQQRTGFDAYWRVYFWLLPR